MSHGPPGCIWTLSCWPGSALSLCPNCPESRWKRRVRWGWGTPRCSWCTSCSSSLNTAMWWRTGWRQRTWGRWRCWHTGACRPRCRTACRLPSRRTPSSRTDRWSRCPCRRSEGEEWSLGLWTDSRSMGQTENLLELRFPLYSHRQSDEVHFNQDEKLQVYNTE